MLGDDQGTVKSMPWLKKKTDAGNWRGTHLKGWHNSGTFDARLIHLKFSWRTSLAINWRYKSQCSHSPVLNRVIFKEEKWKEGKKERRKEGRNQTFCIFLRTLTGIPFAMKPTLPKILFPSCSYFLNLHSFSLSLIFHLLFLHQLTQHLVFSSPHFPLSFSFSLLSIFFAPSSISPSILLYEILKTLEKIGLL